VRSSRSRFRPSFRSRTGARFVVFAAGCAVVTALTGCSILRHKTATEPDVTLAPAPADSAVVETAPAPRPTRPPTHRPPPPKPAAAPDTTRVAVPDTTANLKITVGMSPEERAEKLQLLQDETTRAAQALEIVRNKPLTPLQKDQMADADRFLAEAHAANEASDLHRAVTLAEKARILAEGLAKIFR